MTVLGFIPDPDVADMVIAWTEALADENEPTEYICLSSQENSEIDQRIKDAISRAGLTDSSLTAISSLSPIVELQEKCGQSKAIRRPLVESRKDESSQVVGTTEELGRAEEPRPGR